MPSSSPTATGPSPVLWDFGLLPRGRTCQGRCCSCQPLGLPRPRGTRARLIRPLPGPPHSPLPMGAPACMQPALFFRPLCRPSWEHCPPLPSPILWPGGGNGLGPPEGSASLWTGMRPLGAECRDPSLPRTARRLTSRVQPHAPGPPPGLPPRAPRCVPSNLGPDPPHSPPRPH